MVSAPIVLLSLAGALASAAAWALVRARRISIWTASATVNGALALIALLTERVRGSGDLGTGPAVLAGAGSGVVLYLATAGFMAVAGRWPPPRPGAAPVYGRRGGVSTPAAGALAAGG